MIRTLRGHYVAGTSKRNASVGLGVNSPQYA
jgi:hypothetical protein